MDVWPPLDSEGIKGGLARSECTANRVKAYIIVYEVSKKEKKPKPKKKVLDS